MLRYFLFPLFFFCLSCDHHHGEEKGHEHPTESTPRNLKLEATLTHGSLQIARALKSGVGEAVRTSRLELVKNPPTRQSHLKDSSSILSIAYSANVHGERIDCGCRKNPLGGLARHKTLIDEIQTKSKLWELPANTNLISLDAGDVFFKNVFNSVREEKGETPAIYNAKSVASARKLMPLDVQNIGELDLVFGLETLKELLEISGKKVVSANLYQEDKRVFPPFQILERGQLKIAVIGLTKEKSRKNDFFSSRKVESRDPIKEYNKVRASLPKVDLVILLSNLGIPNSRKLISSAEKKPDVVLVSNTNRMTKEPKFERGVPMLEPGSRGKYFGRADLILNGDSVAFANGGETQLSKLDAYARTYRNYLSARVRYLRQVEKGLRSELDPKKNAPDKIDGHEHSPKTHQHNKDTKSFMKNASVLEKQMVTLSETLADQSASLTIQTATAGDDFVESKVIAVKLDINEEKGIKKLIDRREKKAPKPKKAGLPSR